MDMKRSVIYLVVFTLILSLMACSGNIDESAVAPSTRVVTMTQVANEPAEAPGIVTTTSLDSTPASTPIVVKYDSDDLDLGTSDSAVSTIRLEGDAILFDGSGATVDGGRITITSAGTYIISGTLDDGQIVVDTHDEETVVLILNGVDITCSTSAPIYVANADKTVIALADGTENQVTGEATILDAESDEPDAAIFSHDDLTINGNGSLTVYGNYRNGIVSQDDLKITGGSMAVTAVNDGIKGRDSIAVKDGIITVNAGGDGMQSSNAEDAEKGYITIEGGALNIVAGMDGIQAQTRLAVSGGDVTISSGGGSVNGSNRAGWGNWGMGSALDDPGDSAKGLKAGVDVTISGGIIHIDSSDDAIHSNDSLTISGGELLLASGDDGVHSDSTLEINGGSITITKSYEGIESAVITINDGTIHLVASDDGINAAGGVDGSALGGRPGQNAFTWSSHYHLYVNGGTIFVDALGDGFDINGPIDMTGGTVIINGPTANNNGALDYSGAFNMNGGFLIAVGSAGMAQAPSLSSTQYSVVQTFSSAQAAGTIVHIQTQDGQDMLTFVPTKAYQSVVFSSPDLKNGSTYVIYTGGRSTGQITDGLYAGGAYTGGTQVVSLTISAMVTGAGAFGGGFPSGGGGRTRPPSGHP